MENLIKFIEFETSQRGRRLAENSLSVWYNLNGKNKSFGVTFSNEIKTKKKGVKIGYLGNELCFVFTNDEGAINIFGKGEDRKNIVFYSKGFCELIFKDLNTLTEGKKREVFNLKKVNNEIFVLILK